MELKNIKFPNADLNFIDNPYPALKDFREESPVFYDEKSDLIYLTKYEDVKSIQSSKKYVSAKPANLEGDREWDSRKKAYDYFGRTEEFSLLNLEGSAHNELRGLVAKAFSIRQVELLRPFIENKSREILDPLIGSSFDLIHDYAQPFSIAIIICPLSSASTTTKSSAPANFLSCVLTILILWSRVLFFQLLLGLIVSVDASSNIIAKYYQKGPVKLLSGISFGDLKVRSLTIDSVSIEFDISIRPNNSFTISEASG